MTDNDKRVVIESRNEAKDEDYVSAIVCRDQDEADEILGQVRATSPFMHHKTRSFTDTGATRADTRKTS